jgi:hypothetical protein
VNTSCPNCGGTFSAAEYNAPSCKYCGKVLPNYADAANKVAQVQALMADSDGSGIPNALKGVMAPYAPFIQPGAGAVPPQYGGPYAGPPVQGVGGPPPYGVAAAVPAIIAQTQRRIRSAVLWGVLVPTIIMVIVGGIIAVVAMRAVSAPPPPATHSGRR